MIRNHFKSLKTVLMATVLFLLSACNGDKLDPDLIDSITGKVSVEKITIDQVDFEMTEGESTTLTATVLPADATDKTVSWHSSKEDVVMISNTGKAMALSPGKAVVTAKAGNKTDFITITVIANAVPVTGISLDKTSIVLKVDDSETLTATVTPPDATNKNVSWTSSDATVATVENGKVTGVKPGSVTITAKTEDGGMTAECAVTVKTNLAPSVTIGSENVSAVSVVVKGKANLDSSAPSDLMVGFQYSLSEGILPSNSTTVEATDADSQYNYSRGITGLEPETTYYFRSIVRMSGQDYYGETMSFTTKALSSMIHTEDASNVSAVSAVTNATFDLTDVQYTNKTIGIYYGTSAESLSNTYVAETSATTGAIAKNWPVLKPATEYFYQAYVILDNKVHKDEIKSFTTKEFSSMLETKDASNIAATSAKMNAKLDLTDVQRTTMEYGFYWGTSKDSQTTYVKGGEIAENAYSASLSGLSHKTQYWYKAYLKVDGQEFYGVAEVFTTDVVPVTGVSLDKDQYTFNTIGNTLTLTPTVSPTDATNKAVSWKSSNTSVATVDTNGKVTAVGNGATTITVTTDDQGKTATCEITVAQWVTGITLDKSALVLAEGKSEKVSVASITPENANDKSVAWSSDNTSVATVDQSGKVTAVSKGTATITATANDGSGKSAFCSVTVIRLVSSITLDKTSITICNGKSATLTATVSPSTASNTGVNWTSSNTSVATVSTSGVVTGVGRGTATITVTAKDGSGKSASCTVTVGVNLSANGSANCYIVSSSGAYGFRTTQGNSSTSVGAVSSAVVLWESYGTSTTPSVGSIINNVSYSSNTITFSTPTTLKNGNAVIAAKDASGNILWSWHIWVCSGYNPATTAQTYYKSAGKLMDRNLGATSATPGNVGAFGLLYQWGRKDPFLGSSSISLNTKAKSTLSTWPSSVSSNSSNGTIAYAVKNPTTFITYNSSNYDWYYTGSSSTDNKRWQTSKTIYDPCPPGWRVPDGGSSGVWAKALNSSSSFSYIWDSTNKGMNFSGKFGSASSIWYPAAGFLYSGGGGLSGVGSYGYWWSCTPSDGYAYYLRLYDDVTPSGTDFRASGQSVRCLQE